MARVTTASMTDNQRAMLQRRIEICRSGMVADIAQTVPVMLMQLLMGVVLGIFLGVIPEMAGVRHALLGCVAVGAALGAAAALARAVGVWRRRAAELGQLEEDLAAGVIETSQFDVADAIRLGGEAAHRPSYFLEVASSEEGATRVLFLNDPFAEFVGDNLQQPHPGCDDNEWAALEDRWEQETGFPRQRVRLERTLHGRLLVGLQYEGEQVTISRRLEPGLHDAAPLTDGELIETTLDELCRSMRVE